jgi:hypothetical protein
MRIRILLSALVIAGLARAQGPEAPSFGWLADASGRLRPLEGLAGSFVPGPARESGVISAASSGTWALAKTRGELVVFDRNGTEACRQAAPAGAALFAFASSGEPAAVLFPETGLLLVWSDGRFEAAGWSIERDEEVLAVAGAASFLVRRGDQVWRVDRAVADGRVTAEVMLAGVRAPLVARPDGSVLYADAAALVLRAPQGAEQRIELAGAVAGLSELADGWVRVLLPDRQVAVSFSGVAARVFELPGGRR